MGSKLLMVLEMTQQKSSSEEGLQPINLQGVLTSKQTGRGPLVAFVTPKRKGLLLVWD